MFSTLIAAIFLPLQSLSARFSLARRDRRPARDFPFLFLLRPCSILPDLRKNRKDAQELAVAASLHSLISRVKKEALRSKLAHYLKTTKFAIIQLREAIIYCSYTDNKFLIYLFIHLQYAFLQYIAKFCISICYILT